MIRILLASAAAVSLVSCSIFKGGDNYDTADAYDTSNPYGVPGGASGESVPYQPVNPPADNPTYSPPAYDYTAPAPTPAPAPPPSRPALSGTTHTVAKGDTLWGISRKYGVSVDAIKQANGLTRDIVVLGSTLQIPAR